MSIPVKIWFGDFSIKNVEIFMPTIPRIGEDIVFPSGFLQYHDGTELGTNAVKVLSVDYQIDDKMQTSVELNVQEIK